jgi:hypothetical protein
MNALLLAIALLGQCDCKGGSCPVKPLPSLAQPTIEAKQQTPEEAYATARAACMKDGRRLYVYVSTENCQWCKVVSPWLAHLAARGRLVYLDAEKQSELALSAADSGPVPRLARYRRVGGVWKRAIFVGADEIKAEIFPSGEPETQKPQPAALVCSGGN